jgi:general secretion pathway protein A
MDIFSFPALMTIYRKTGGYPRKIINLCHHCVLAMIVQNRSSVGYRLVRSCIRRIYPKEPVRWKGAAATAGIAVFAATILLAFQIPDQLKILLPEKITAKLSALHQTEYRGANQPDANHAASDQIDSQVTMDSVEQAEIPVAVETESTPTDLPETVSDEVAAEAKAQVASIEETPVASQDSNQVLQNEPQSQEAYAQMLGDIKLKHNETLSRVIQRVYGLYTSKYFRLLILANPDIDDPDRVEIGQTVHLPAIPATVPPKKEKVWWILMTEDDTLEAAYDYLRTYPDHAPPARLVPYWTSQSGIRFAVILKEYFYDKESADQHLKHIPPGLLPKGMVSTLWDENTVFFANPFSGRKKISKSELKISIDNPPPVY